MKILDELSPALFDEDRCREAFLKKYHGGKTACPQCGRNYHDSEKFWRNAQCYCQGCGKKFFATTGTPFSSAKIGFREIFMMFLLVDLGWTSKDIAAALKLDQHTVAHWRKKDPEILGEQ